MMEEQIKLLEKEIMESLPLIPYVLDQVGAAMEWAKKEDSDAEYLKILKITTNVKNFVTKNSEPNFFKTHLVLASLLSRIEDVVNKDEFSTFRTASGAVEKTLKNITIDPKLIEERGCFKAITMQMANIARENEDDFIILLYQMLGDLEEIGEGMKLANIKSPITPEDYIKVVGYAFVMSNLRMSNLTVLEDVKQVMNKIDIILNNDFNF